jgi:hypothetical protein
MDIISYSAEWVISSVVLAAGVTGMVTLHNLVLDKNHVNELRDANLRAYAGSVSGAQSKMIVLTFYFE